MQLLVDGIVQHKATHELAARVQQELLDQAANTPGSSTTLLQELSARLASHSEVMDSLRSAAAINPYLSALLQVRPQCFEGERSIPAPGVLQTGGGRRGGRGPPNATQLVRTLLCVLNNAPCPCVPACIHRWTPVRSRRSRRGLLRRFVRRPCEWTGFPHTICLPPVCMLPAQGQGFAGTCGCYGQPISMPADGPAQCRGWIHSIVMLLELLSPARYPQLTAGP